MALLRIVYSLRRFWPFILANCIRNSVMQLFNITSNVVYLLKIQGEITVFTTMERVVCELLFVEYAHIISNLHSAELVRLVAAHHILYVTLKIT